ncbi:PREDICTED: sodium/calcium exchanger 2-like isoform X1 [Cyprinodon variegatus]|uniref:sodium/calcium exchanger 2-like isoform X1 n=1 Tax=Cyprinodon variegatus TaxID=28743 RepID=UPI0007425AD5|nr:PREDICTED: sodium/calcium exchanger 2-like isoform X1 [Cyprinodon variegatus]XP_015240713.1 PREDICTED: sodium/calcium exchanger 2-like isoform X1 [Cyprinodon variegatus]
MGHSSGHRNPPFFLFVLLLCHHCISISPQVLDQRSSPDQTLPSTNNTVSEKKKCAGVVVCKPGILLPVWLPLNPPVGEQAGRAIVYFLSLMYIFLGVSIIADRFMASIEVITSQEKEVTITQPNGETTVKTVRIWNETVSNLTLMALGSSAPEILLSVIEVCGHNFNAGELGPGTIVGSAAFNMLVIIGLCVSVIPDGQSRKIKHLRVFFITAFWSIFAYIWLYLILAVISPGIVEVVRILKELKEKHPDKDLDQLIEMANYSALVHQKKSRAFYRVQATRMMIGAGNILKKHAADQKIRSQEQDQDRANCSNICFENVLYQCTENCGSVSLWVVLDGGTGQNTFYVDYCTENGSANAGSDYEFNKGTLVFKPGETRKEIKVGILDDDIFEEDEHFFVRLQNLRLEEGSNEGTGTPPKGKLVEPMLATVTILDDDHAGIFTFGQQMLRVSENTGMVTVTVLRNSGCRGTVAVPYHTEDGTAKAGIDYEEARGEVEFTNEQTSQTLQIRIINVEEYEKQENFFIVLEDPKWLKRGISALLLNQGNPTPEEEEARRISEMGKPILGEHSRLEVIIKEACDFKTPNGVIDQVTVDQLLKDTNLAGVIGTHSWKEQFIEAVTVNAGDDEDGQEQRMPNCFDYFMHIFCVFWKLLFAFVPPTKYWNGWACFIVSISVIGILTAIIGDLASHFGCTVGLRDSVTAVVFVALGTSLPDTFASKVAATQDQYADACVGNVTGSNAVNVFLGIGLAWSVAAVYWEVKGKVFQVDPGSLAFSVTLFTIFAFFCMGVLMLRRRPSIGGELGGPRISKILTSLLFFGLWFLYVLFSSLEAYCHIQGF